MSEHAHKEPTKLEKRGKVMSELAQNQCTGNWKKREGKSHVPEHALLKSIRIFL